MQSCIHLLNNSIKTASRRSASFATRSSFERRLVSRSRSYATVSASELSFGQPLHETHPHLLKNGELTPGISALEYAQRRSLLAAKLPKDSIAIVAASEVKYRTGAVHYEFHQDSNFFYLTGFNEPEAVAVIGKGRSEEDHSFHLYVRPKDVKAEQWEGARSGTQAALDVFNADETGDISQITKYLPPLISSASKVFTDFGHESQTKSFFSRFLQDKSEKAEGLAKVLELASVQPLRDIINDIRSIKSDAEISNMRKVGRISGRVITNAMRQAWTKEQDLASYLDYEFKRNGCDGSAYIPVVAGPKGAATIHYTHNNQRLENGQLVLVDAGGEYGNYITDITRVWPVAANFTPAQKDLYNVVLAAQRDCISLCRANASISLDGLHDVAESTMRDGLKQLGFDMSGKAIETLFPHHVGHYVGLDVHDTPGQSRKAHLKPRQCVTVEPGLYIPNTDDYPTHFRGLSVRIEDSVCVQEEHPLVLTTEAVKEVEDIEALRG